MGAKLAILVAAVLAVAVAIGFYVGFLTGGPTPYPADALRELGIAVLPQDDLRPR